MSAAAWCGVIIVAAGASSRMDGVDKQFAPLAGRPALAWAGAAGGVAFSTGWVNAPAPARAGCYLALGWISVIALPQLIHELSAAPLVLLGVGGLLYTAGAVIYARQRPNPWPRTFGFHEIFHALVIAAAAAQYTAVIGWMLPAARI